MREGLTLHGVGWAFTTFSTANWHPLTWLSLMSDVELFGLAPGAHHLMSVAFHLASSCLLLLLLFRATGALWPSALAAACFALHPMHVEAVAWGAQRKDVLSTFFLMLTLVAYLRHAERPGAGSLAAAVLFFALGLLAKPMLVSVPLLLLLLDYWPLRRTSGTALRSLVTEKVPFLVLALGVGVVTLVAQHSQGALGDLERYPLGLRFANAAVSYLEYLRKTLWPTDLAVFYPHPLQIPAWQWMSALALLALVSAAVWRSRVRLPFLVVGWLWFVVALAPVIGLVQVGRQAMADRYSYVPHIGILVALAFGLREAMRAGPRWRWPVAGAATAGLCALALRSHRQVATWRTSETLWRHAFAVTADNALAHFNLAAALALRGDLEGASHHYTETLRIDPRYRRAHYNDGVVLARLGRHDEARAQLERELALDPANVEAHVLLAGELSRRGELAAALSHFMRAAELDPTDPDHASNAASTLIDLGRLDEAAALLDRALALSSHHAYALSNRSRLLEREGRYEEAERTLLRAQELAPELPGLQDRLLRLRRATSGS